MLTPRQTEVVEHIAQGESDKQIARSIHCEPRTVIAHVQAIKQRLGAVSRAHIIVKAIQAGVLTIKVLIIVIAIFNNNDDLRRSTRTRLRTRTAKREVVL